MDFVVLFLIFAKVSLLTFGGGLASLPFLYQAFVVDYRWLGPIILNSATLLGYRHLGMAGSVIGTLAVVLAPLTVVIALDWIFKSASGRAREWVDRIRLAMRPVVAGLLIVALWTVALPVIHKTVLWSFTALSALLYFTVPFLKKYPQALLFGMAILTTVLYAFGVTALGA